MPQVLVGHDVYAYGVEGVNLDGSLSGVETGFIGVFKTFTVDAEKTWEEVPASSAFEMERRRTLFDWTITMENQIRSGGMSALQIMLTYDYIKIVWQDEIGGLVLTAIGGIKNCQGKRDRGEGVQTMTVVDAGQVITNGLSTLTYG